MYHQSLKGFITRPVDDDGETLKVRTFQSGAKALVDPCDPDVIVTLEVGRVARLVHLSASIQAWHGLQGYALTQFTFLPEVNGFQFGFVTRGLHARIYLQDLPEGQLVDVYPRERAEGAVVRVFVPHFSPELAGRVAVQVAV